MKKIVFLITFLFLGLGGGERLHSVTRQETILVLSYFLLHNYRSTELQGQVPEIFNILLGSFERNKDFLNRTFSDSFLSQILLEVPSECVDDASETISFKYYLLQIELFRNCFLNNYGNEGLEHFLEKQKDLFLRLIQEFFSGNDLERIRGELEFYCQDNENKWFKALSRIFWDAKSRFRAIGFKEVLDKDYADKLSFIMISIRDADVGAGFHDPGSSSGSSFLREWVTFKGLNPRDVSFERLIEMLKGEPHILELMFRNFKIHLMPKEDDLLLALTTFINAFKDDVDFQKSITSFKVKALLEEAASRAGCPKIVIYVDGDRELLDVVLNKICGVFRGWTGLERAPAFNEKAEGIVYFAQGDRGDKILWPEFYDESSGRAYFDENKVRRLINVDHFDPSGARELRKGKQQLQKVSEKGQGRKKASGSGRSRTRGQAGKRKKK